MDKAEVSCLEDACERVCDIWESAACADDKVVGDRFTITRRPTGLGVGGFCLTITPNSPDND